MVPSTLRRRPWARSADACPYTLHEKAERFENGAWPPSRLRFSQLSSAGRISASRPEYLPTDSAVHRVDCPKPISLCAASCSLSPPVFCTISRPCISACVTPFSYQLFPTFQQSYTRLDGFQSRSHILAAWPGLLLNAIDSLSAVETSHDRHTTCTSRVWPAWLGYLDLRTLFDFIFPFTLRYQRLYHRHGHR